MAAEVIRPRFCLLAKNDGLASGFVKRGYLREFSIGPRIDVAIFDGKGPVTPFLYGEKAVKSTTGEYDVGRDKKEVYLFKNLKKETVKIGFNRGALLLNILCGGRSIQHGNGHMAKHRISAYDDEGLNFFVQSQHEQIMVPAGHARVLAYANECTKLVRESTVHVHPSGQRDSHESEVILYPEQNTMCIQFELGTNPNPLPERYVFDILEELFLPENPQHYVSQAPSRATADYLKRRAL